MSRTVGGVILVGLMAVGFASPAVGKPNEARERQGGGSSQAVPRTAAPAPAPAPARPAPAVTAPAPSPRPTPQVTSTRSPESPVVAEARQRSGRSGARSGGGERQGSSGGNSGAGSVAVPRGSGGSSSTTSAEGDRGDDDRDRRAARRSDRPRDDRVAVGRAVARTRPRGRPVVIPSWAWGRPSYWYGYNSLGLGYFYYDPYWWGYPGYGYGYGYGLGYGNGYGYGYPGHYRDYYDRGQLRLKIKPRDAEVRVDGYFVGTVDEFDGAFQRLNLETGPHRVEITKPGYRPLVFDVRILPDETVTYRGELEQEP